jgi:hypothetical protein
VYDIFSDIVVEEVIEFKKENLINDLYLTARLPLEFKITSLITHGYKRE